MATKKIIKESSVTDIGQLMGMAMGKLKGKVDGSKVRLMAEKVLSQK